MRIEIAQSIREILDERKIVTIQGLGSIKLIQKPAYFGDLRQSMFPPSVDMIFEETSSSNAPLVRRLMENEGLSKKNAEKALSKYCEAVVNALVNYRKVRLKGICRLDQSKSGKIKIIADPAFIGAYFKDLPEVPVKIIPTKKTEDPVLEKEVESSITSVEDALVIPGLAEEKTSEKTPEPKEVADDKAHSVVQSLIQEIKQEPPSVQAQTPIAEETPVSEVQWDPKAHDEGYGIIPWIIGAILLTALVAFTIFSIRQCKPSEEVPFSNETDTEHITDMIVEDDNLQADSISTPVAALPDKCIIITGSFASQNNVQLMKNKVYDAGYEVYTEVSGNYTRVGLTFECNDVDLPSFLQNIRATIAPQAWYLDPELYVECE